VIEAPGREWLEPDRRGGFASGTVGGFRTRRYHALLLTASPSRFALVNGLETWVEAGAARYPLSTQHYAPDVVYPRGIDFLVDFVADPWPAWTFALPGGTRIVQEIAASDAGTVIRWRALAGTATLRTRPLLSGRDYHALMRENPAFDFTARTDGGNVGWRPYAGVPAVAALSSGSYEHAPDWYRNFLYTQEAARGLDCIEDLASPGVFTFDLADGDAILALREGDDLRGDAQAMATAAFARRSPAADRAADAYVVRRDGRRTIIAGYPWFTDWGRDTFIAMRGLLLARGRADAALDILHDWAAHVSEGMLPNRFPDGRDAPQYNAVDASLWFVIVAHEAQHAGVASDRLAAACAAILDGYQRGTRYGIRCDDDGLLACGQAGVQLTWMDARVGDRVITPRIGKPVEVQALWINALSLAGRSDAAQRAVAAFRARFPNESLRCLYDVVDEGHVAGRSDASVRPNQLFAVGGLPVAVVDGTLARDVVDAVERHLVTPAGLRSLAPGDPAYRGRYEGGPAERDGAYHQGTAWPWLIGAFVDAWLRVHRDDPDAKAMARERFVAPLAARVGAAGIGHLFEIADGDAPHAPRGCPFQAWSLGELIRAQGMVA
jgi:predicted glycogen debranching enzyme